jgi:signal peptidase II
MSVAFLSLLMIAVDQLVKLLIVEIFPFLIFYNSGIAFGLLTDREAGVVVFVALFFLVAVFFLKRFAGFGKDNSITKSEVIGWGLFIGGAVSNLLDRFLYGAIVDFVTLNSFYTFNLADIAIIFGIVIIGAEMLK